MTQEQKHQELDRIIELIHKCLALSSSSNENEASLASAKVQELLEKYNLTMTDIERPEDTEVVEGEIPYNEDWIALLYNKVALQNFCRTIRFPHKKTISVIGRKTNMFIAVETAQWLQNQIINLYSKEKLTLDQIKYNNFGASQYKKAWFAGIVTRIGERLSALYKEREVINPSLTALTVNLRAEATNFLDKNYPNRRNATQKYYEQNGFNSGYNKGNQVGIVRSGMHIDGGPLRLGNGV